ncbi:glycosyltransferase family 4 protein [Nafulsella turpanensis]|uniref:glycosyltransferase family 4 protein n=1 Tax=Nafulsella turpanensis TaxID=1265690 RepID=UPI000347262D|nr:glycosyltransferase family 4 protein [Nafulsella turpanensis]
MKTRIINILPHKPDYDYLQDKPRPKVNWDTPDGQWVGIYRNEIPDKLGEEILKVTDEFEYEVWQPDYRADKMYSHRFEDGLVHRLFPAEDVNELHGLKLRKAISSRVLISFLKKYAQEHPVIINLNGDFCHINLEILEKCPELPILQTFRGTLYLPKNQIFKVRKNVPAALSYYLKHLKVKKLIGNIDSVMVQNSFYLDDLEKMYDGPIEKLTSGCEFDVWKPMEKQEARKALNLPADKKIFFTSSLLIPIKQLDKLMEVLTPLSKQYDFLLLVSGHGTPEYEAYLKEKAKDLLAQDKIRFVGYLTGDDLRRHYCASDLFVHTSISEGGPVAAMKAIACGTPVLITKIANVAEELEKNGCGKLIEPFDYEQWAEVFKSILEGEEVKPFPREKAARMYDWQAVAREFVKTFHELEKKSPYKQMPQKETYSATSH